MQADFELDVLPWALRVVGDRSISFTSLSSLHLHRFNFERLMFCQGFVLQRSGVAARGRFHGADGGRQTVS